uniref:Uncharacterized protein n=1 Tax=Bactrocera latifrons TaxID=174628 RepID=A0A0K8W5J8_BACLA
MSLTNRLTNLELMMAADKHYATLNYLEEPTLKQLEDVLYTFHEEKIDIKKRDETVYESQETYRRCTARKRLEFCDITDCIYEESAADFKSSFTRVGITDDFQTPAQLMAPINFEQMTKQERGLVRNYSTISMEEDDVDSCSEQYKRRRYQ